MQDKVVFQGFVAKLSEYQKGNLKGEWVAFPTTKKRMEEVLLQLDISNPDNMFIATYKSEQRHPIINYLKPFTHLDEVNFLANIFGKLREDTKMVLSAVIDIEGLSEVNQCINAIYNLDKYALIPKIKTPVLLERYMMEYPDSPAVNKSGSFCEMGYVYDIGTMEEIYDGNVNRIPKNSKVCPLFEPFQEKNLSQKTQDKLKIILADVPHTEGFQAYIANTDALGQDEIKGEWVSFPTDTHTIQEVFERIELTDPFKYACLGVQSSVKGLSEKIVASTHLDILNYIAEEVEGLAYRDGNGIAILESCIEAFKSNHSLDILNFIENIDCFRLARNKQNMQEVANKYMGEMKLPKSLANHIHIDIPSSEKELKRDEDAYFTKNGFLERLSLPVKYYKSQEDVPESSRIFPVLKEINKEDVKKSIVATLENAKSNKEPTKPSKSVKRDVER
ncbi:antirestriction protein ArdA [Listeria booriae]|uniref:Antirestriction protein ArdA n=1 Tax=Listeria booriae TaxID=1552123 RepID=A0A841Y649_9LIST|nr:antirestriction protein ArdA [Listeria booriae]MBC1227569.1 antirestriction protein ArdA [Listeria booriae]MBC1318085.1 antirestriction protein ArdA [Listeria booriae]